VCNHPNYNGGLSFDGSTAYMSLPYGLWPLDEVRAKSFTVPGAVFTTDSDTLGLYHLEESESPMDDDSASNNDGTIVATVATHAQGKFENTSCIRIAPDAQTPGRIEANDVVLGSGNWTLEAWVNPEADTGERAVLAQAPWRRPPAQGFAGELDNPVIMLSLSEGYPALLVRYLVDKEVGEDEIGEVRIVGKTKATLNAWHHLAAVRNGPGLYLYIDGQCAAMGELPTVANATIVILSADKLIIGCGDVNGTGVRAGGNFAGWIDEVRISSIARYTGLVTPELTEYGPDGELLGGVALTETGRIGRALAFDGSGYVQLTGSGDFLKLGAAKRTIELWVKAASTSGAQMLYEEGGSTSGFALRINSGVLEFTAKDNGGTPETLSVGYTSTDWHKVTAVYNEGAMALYVDDESADVATASFTSVAAQTDGAALGGTLGTDAFGGSTTGGSFTGSIDNVRVLNDAVAPTAMTTTEIHYYDATRPYNARNQLVIEKIISGPDSGTYSLYEYNANGENTYIRKYDSGDNPLQTITMTYDDFGRMLTWSDGTNTETHTYRGAGWERASTASGGTTTKFLYDGDNVVGDLVSGAFTRQYVTPFLDENLSMTVQGETPATYYYNRDGLGSVRNLTDASQVIKNSYAYTAFGFPYSPATQISEGLTQRYTFQGREASAVGAPMFYRNRMYAAGLGRFGRRDPKLGGDRLYNTYGLPGARAVGHVDPFGLGDETKKSPVQPDETQKQAMVHLVQGMTPEEAKNLMGLASRAVKKGMGPDDLKALSDLKTKLEAQVKKEIECEQARREENANKLIKEMARNERQYYATQAKGYLGGLAGLAKARIKECCPSLEPLTRGTTEGQIIARVVDKVKNDLIADNVNSALKQINEGVDLAVQLADIADKFNNKQQLSTDEKTKLAALATAVVAAIILHELTSEQEPQPAPAGAGAGGGSTGGAGGPNQANEPAKMDPGASGGGGGAQDKKLSNGEIKKLEDNGFNVHELKGGKSASKYDLYKDDKGNILVKPKGGAGPGDPTGININDL
jgi:RHS repeat-associated protein